MPKDTQIQKIQKKINAMREAYRDLVLALNSVEKDRERLARELDEIEDSAKIKILKKKLQNL